MVEASNGEALLQRVTYRVIPVTRRTDASGKISEVQNIPAHIPEIIINRRHGQAGQDFFSNKQNHTYALTVPFPPPSPPPPCCKLHPPGRHPAAAALHLSHRPHWPLLLLLLRCRYPQPLRPRRQQRGGGLTPQCQHTPEHATSGSRGQLILGGGRVSPRHVSVIAGKGRCGGSYRRAVTMHIVRCQYVGGQYVGVVATD